MFTQKVFIGELSANLIYEMTETMKSIDDNGDVQVYGVKVYKEGCTLSEVTGDYCFIADISSDYSFVKNIVSLLAEHETLPVHIRDVVENCIA